MAFVPYLRCVAGLHKSVFGVGPKKSIVLLRKIDGDGDIELCNTWQNERNWEKHCGAKKT